MGAGIVLVAREFMFARGAFAVFAFALFCETASAVPGVAPDLVAKQLIRQELPALLTPCDAILRITVTENRGKPGGDIWTISDPASIAMICEALRNAVVQDRFEIGHQFHSPAHARELLFVRRSGETLRLVSVGEGMFWVFWAGPRVAREPVNLQSESFEAVVGKYLQPEPVPAGVPADFVLRISRQGCEGHCPDYAVQVDARGSVIWNGRAYVRTQGEARARIGPEQVRRIFLRARKDQFFMAQKSNIACLDTPRTEVALTQGGKTHALAIDSCAAQSAPSSRKLAAFLAFAEGEMGVNRWRK